MKIANSIIVALVLCLLANANAYSETIFQTVRGDAALTSDGKKAIDNKLVEVKTIPTGSGTVARLVGSMPQWGYVSYWFGIPAPAGKVIVRFRIYVDDTATGDYSAYVRLKSGQVNVGKLVVPADAKKDSFIDVDMPITEPEDWSGLSLKKIAPSDKPSPWIDSVSVVQP